MLAAVSRDLRRQYGEGYRVVRAESGEAALEALRALHSRGDPVALFLVDRRTPHMNGVEFLTEAAGLYPDAKRVMLTAYADTDAANSAINESRIHYYLLKPWDPPETQLYPVLDDLLDDWRADCRPPFTGLRIVGTRWSADGYTLHDCLARHGVPYRWLDIEGGGEAGSEAADLAGGVAPNELPLVVLEDDLSDYLDDHGVERPWDARALYRAGQARRGQKRPAPGLPATWRCGCWSVNCWRVPSASPNSWGDEYSYMDQAHEKRLTDLREGLNNTLTILKHKFKKKSLRVVTNYAELSLVPAYGGELNQV